MTTAIAPCQCDCGPEDGCGRNGYHFGSCACSGQNHIEPRLRTWSAKIEFRQGIAGPIIATLDAKPSEYDLLRDQTISAVREASVMVQGDAVTVSVTLYKTTKARGTQRDRTYNVFRDRRGQVRYS